MVLVFPYLAEPGRAIAEAARILRPGGRLLITDLMPHDRAEYRQTLGHQWQGVSEVQLGAWMEAAGLTLSRYRPVPLDAGAKGPMLFTGIGTRLARAES
jgi:SAM-dependent methyltransferase